MPNKPDLIVPGTPHYEEQLKELTDGVDMSEAHRASEWMTQYTAGSISMPFETTPLPGRDAECHVNHAIDRSRTDAPKLIFHFCKLSTNEMAVLGKAMQEKLAPALHQLPSDILCDAAQSELYRSQWDLIIFGVPALRTREFHRLVMRIATEALRGE